MEGYFFLCRSKFAGGTFSHVCFSYQYECAFPVSFMDSRAIKEVAILVFETYLFMQRRRFMFCWPPGSLHRLKCLEILFRKVHEKYSQALVGLLCFLRQLEVWRRVCHRA